MHYIVRHDVRHGGSSLLNYAAKKNLGGMARNILHIGGDVNTQRGCRVGFAKRQPTPLVTAASHGHKKMVRILLKTGASHFVDGMRVPLAVAISNRHENVALILSQELDFGDMFLTKTGQMVFQMGCEMKLVNLVCHYLERGSHCAESVNAPRLHPRSTALYRTLLKDASKDILLKRELHANAYQIVLMLLQHGASPDIRIGATRSPPLTARDIASKHPDPRVRNLLLKATPATESKGSPLIGRPWISFKDGPVASYNPYAEASVFENSCYATLWDFLERPNVEIPPLMEEDGTEDCILDASEIASLVDGGMRGLKTKLESIGPPPLSFFPQLGNAKATEQQAANAFWAKIPVRARSGAALLQTPSMSGMGAISKNVKRLEEPAETDPFPQLGRPGPTSNDTGEDFWARFPKNKGFQRMSESQQTPPHEEGNGMNRSFHKSSKKKKWEPLLL